jgi:hypothetical protein
VNAGGGVERNEMNLDEDPNSLVCLEGIIWVGESSSSFWERMKSDNIGRCDGLIWEELRVDRCWSKNDSGE